MVRVHRHRKSGLTRSLSQIIPLVLTLAFAVSVAAQSHSESKGKIISIPLSKLDVSQATATVSVLEEPQSPFNILLDACQSKLPEEFRIEGEDLSEEARKLCQMMESWKKRYLPPPGHRCETFR